jgi:hypothetical protein
VGVYFNYIVAVSLLVEETGVPGENHLPYNHDDGPSTETNIRIIYGNVSKNMNVNEHERLSTLHLHKLPVE